MTDWRHILAWKVRPEHYHPEIGDRVRLLQDEYKQFFRVTLPQGTTGTVVALLTGLAIVELDWDYPRPCDVPVQGHQYGSDDGWGVQYDKLEIL